MRRFIRLGDRTSHGGIVMTASKLFYIGDKAVARKGDICTCPIKGHRNCIIMEGDPDFLIDDIPAALEGHKLSCGAVLYSSMPNAGRVYEGGDSAWSGDHLLFETNGSAARPQTAASSKSVFDFDEHFVLFDDRTGEPAQNFEFHLAGQSEAAKTGITDTGGKTSLVQSKAAEIATFKARQTKIVIG